MKQYWLKVIAGAAALLLCCSPLFAVGTVTQTITNLSTTTAVIEFTCTADATAATYPATATSTAISAAIYGWYVQASVTDPGSTAPTSNYDITLTNANGADLLGGALANRSASATELAFPVTTSPPIDSALTLTITNNSVNSAVTVVKVYVGRSATIGNPSISGTASTNVAQYGGTTVGAGNAVHVQPGTSAVFTGRSTPWLAGFTTDYDSTLTALPNVLTVLTATTTAVTSCLCTNTDAAAAHSVTITNTAGNYYVGPAFILQPLSSAVFWQNTKGIKLVGIKWNADTAAKVNCQITGLQ